MASPKDVLRGGKDSEAATLVAAALRSVCNAERSADYGVRESQLGELPEVRAILESPDELRRECILVVADRKDDRAAGRHWRTKTARLFSVIARKNAGLTGADLEALLSPPRAKLERQEVWWLTEKIRVLSRQIEHSYLGLSGDGKARVKPLLERVASEVDHAPTAVRIRTLIGTGDEIRYELIDDGDEVGPRLRAIIAASGEPDEARAAALNLLAAFPASGRPAEQWHAEAERVRSLLARPAVLTGGLLDVALDASDFEEEHPYAGWPIGRQTYTVTRGATAGNESFLCGAVTFAGVVADPALLPHLRRLAVKSVTVIAGPFGYPGYPRSLRLANMSVKAMADIGGPASITELLALERSIRHGTLLRQIRQAIGTVAAARGTTRGELLERAVEDHGLGRDGTRRMPLSRGSAVIEIDGRSALLV